MQFYKTVDNDGFVRIEEDEGAAITLLIDDEYASILSLLVPRGSREEGIGTGLIQAAEKYAYDRGVRTLEADFPESLDGMSDFFESVGFEVSSNAPVYSIDIDRILSSDRVKKALRKATPGAYFSSLGELMRMQWDEVFHILSRFSVGLSAKELNMFSQDKSGVVFDDEETAQAIILCTENDDCIHVDFVGASSKGGSTYVVTALQGVLLEIVSEGGAKVYSNMTALGANKSVIRLMEKIVVDYTPEKIDTAMYAARKLTGDHIDVDIEDDPDEDMNDAWRREIRKVPMQGNIGWKSAWYRSRTRKKKEEPREVDSSTDSSEESYNGKGFPLELDDPLDYDYGFDKGEDERYGLISDDVIRITEDNLEDFTGILPVDAYYDLPRPYFRGLAVSGDYRDDYLVYELKDFDEEKESSSEILWIKADEYGEKLLREYTNEVENLGVKSSSLEMPEDDVLGSILQKADFDIIERESNSISVTVGEFMKLPFAMGNTPDYIMSLRDVEERQFKRGIGNCILNERKGILEDLAFLPKHWFEEDISSCVITDGRVTGLLLLHQLPSKRLMVDMIFSSSGDARADILRMMQRSIRATAEKYPHNTPVILKRHNKMTMNLTKRLFPNKAGAAVLYGSRKENG